MKIKITSKSIELPPEGLTNAVVSSTSDSGANSCTIEFSVSCNGKTFPAIKRYKKELKAGSDLSKDAQTILGRPFHELEAAGEFDSDELNGKPCQVVIIHKKTSGGKLQAVVNTVLPAAKPADTTAEPTLVTAQ